MARPTGATKLTYRGEARRNTREGRTTAAGFPRWITIPFILIIGLILWTGVLSDSTGHLTVQDVDSILYVVAVIGVAGLLAYADRRRSTFGKVHRSMPPPRALWLCLAGQIILAVSPASAQNDVTRFETKVLPVLAKNCFPCHGADVQTADVNFSVIHDGKSAAEKPDLWRKVRDKIRGHLMPPPPIPGLSAADADAVTGWIDSIAGTPETVRAAPNPGRVTARRLNRVEYDNTIRDFLGVSLRSADDFPIDNQGYGCDNIGDVLTLSPMLTEKYMAAARSVSRVAVYGETYEKKPGLIGKLLPKSVQDDGLVSGNTLPFSIRGDLEGVYRFPVEADYVLQFRITNRRGNSPPGGSLTGRGWTDGRRSWSGGPEPLAAAVDEAQPVPAAAF